MNEAWIIFFAGIGGVFSGMLFLYVAIHLISMVAARIPVTAPPDNKGKHG
jgi:Na+-transporting methylmalonyl-CoA/oxaloacetate decarboxylase gamma subunit